MCNMLSVSRKNLLFRLILTMIIYEKIEAMPPAEPPPNQQLLQPQQQQQQQQHNVKSFRNALNQQGIQSLLQSIENRLSNLDQIYSHRYSQRVDLNTDQYVRKIEMLESKVTRLESSLDAQLGKLSENLSSKNFRDDITKDQIFRKIDSIYERFNHKLTYVEEKFDMAFFKLQNRIDMGVTKIERLDDSINVRNADMEAEISEGVQLVKTIKNNVNSLEEKIMNVSRVSAQNLEKIDAAINTNIVKSLSNIEHKIVNINQDEYLNNFTKKEPSYNNYSNKINNMYNELWKKSNIIETNIGELMNLTRKEIEDIKQKTANSNNQNDDTLDIILDAFKNILQRKFTDLGRKMEDNFKDIIATQNLFLESCKSIQMDETQLERKISLNLEKLLDSLSNRNLVSFKELQNTEEIIKIQSNNMERLINQNTNTIMKLSEKTSEDRKKLEKIISSFKKDVANFRASIEQQIYLDSLESSEIGNLILAQVNDLDKKMNKDNMNYNAKQMPQVDDVLKQTKDIFAKQVNISAIYNTIKRVDGGVNEIRKLLYDIHNKINNCKLNATQIHFDYNEKPTDESVDIVFDDETDKNTAVPNINLFRYNYSIIDDNNNNNNIKKISPGVDIPVASTVPSTQKTNNYDYDDGIIINSFSSEENSELNSEEYTTTKNANILSENKLNSTNNIISIDKEKAAPNTNIPPSDDSDATSKTESNESGVDIFEELYAKFFGNQNMPENEYFSTNKPEIITTTELDNTDFDEYFE